MPDDRHETLNKHDPADAPPRRSRRRRRLQYSVRALFGLITLSAIALSVVMTSLRSHEAAWQREQSAMKNLAQYIVEGESLIERRQPSWLEPFTPNSKLHIFDRYVRIMLFSDKLTDRDVKDVCSFRQIEQLLVSDARITDAGAAELSSLTHLEWLDVSYTLITDAGVAHLARLRALRILDLSRSRVTGRALACLRGMPRLEVLGLSRTAVADESLSHLTTLPSLHDLDLVHTG